MLISPSARPLCMHYDCLLNTSVVEIPEKGRADLIVVTCKLSLIYFKFTGLAGSFDGC